MAHHIGIIGSGSWSTALAKILTDNNNHIHWWIRNEETIRHMQLRHHNKHYLTSVYFDTGLLQLNHRVEEVVKASDTIILAVPSAFLRTVLDTLPPGAFEGKRVVSAIKGLVARHQPSLINDYLADTFNLPPEQYFTITGPCHAEEVANVEIILSHLFGGERC